MSELTEIHKIHEAKHGQLNVVFVHGLDGDPRESWCFGAPGATDWSGWIVGADPDVSIYSVGYRINSSDWAGGAMPLQDRALNVLETMKFEINLDRPTIYVAHSYGGLLVKAMLRKANDTGRYPEFLKNFSGVTFFGTPHSGAKLSSYLTNLGKIGRASKATQELEYSSAVLRDLNDWFRSSVINSPVPVAVFAEMLKTHGVMVVDLPSADPGIPGVAPIPVDANHIELSKPVARDMRVGTVIDMIKKAGAQLPVRDRSSQMLGKVLAASDRELPYLLDEIEALLARYPEDRTLRTAKRYCRDSIVATRPSPPDWSTNARHSMSSRMSYSQRKSSTGVLVRVAAGLFVGGAAAGVFAPDLMADIGEWIVSLF